MLPEDKADLVMRLRSAEGHLRAVIHQVETDVSCEATLHQLQAVEAALQAAESRLACCGVQAILEELRNSVHEETRQEGLNQLAHLYQMLTHTSAMEHKR